MDSFFEKKMNGRTTRKGKRIGGGKCEDEGEKLKKYEFTQEIQVVRPIRFSSLESLGAWIRLLLLHIPSLRYLN